MQVKFWAPAWLLHVPPLRHGLGQHASFTSEHSPDTVFLTQPFSHLQ